MRHVARRERRSQLQPIVTYGRDLGTGAGAACNAHPATSPVPPILRAMRNLEPAASRSYVRQAKVTSSDEAIRMAGFVAFSTSSYQYTTDTLSTFVVSTGGALMSERRCLPLTAIAAFLTTAVLSTTVLAAGTATAMADPIATQQVFQVEHIKIATTKKFA